MKLRHLVLGCIVASLAAWPATAQTPILSSVEAPYAALQASVHIAGGVYGPGSVPYGPVGTPLVLSGSDFGSTGTAQFVGYKNGAVDPGTTVQATVTLWTPTMLFLTVPTSAKSGLITVTSASHTSYGLPFLVTPGTYAGSCPAFPPQNQLQITTASLNDGAVSQAYSATLSATGGTQSYAWSITSGTLPTGLSLNASTGAISGTPTGAYGPADLTFQVADSSSPQNKDQVVLNLTIDPSGVPSVVYSYCISSSPSASCTSPSGGYDAAGNILSYYDSVTGTWSMASGYDSLSRLTAAQATAGTAYSGLQATWNYDSFGNRTGESFGGTDTGNAPVPGSSSFTYSANNQVLTANPGPVPTYDGAGNVTADGNNQYLYDAEGRICAVKPLLQGSAWMEYLYNAEGTRVAKGTITSWSCDTSSNGFTMTASYILGPGNEQLTELRWTSNTGPAQTGWHSNVWGGGTLMSTYYNPDPNPSTPPINNFYLADWLGTRRAVTDSAGNTAETCHSLPFGNDEDCIATPTEHLFTGKERDTESGNDYFGARYYASSMGRFMSPDPSGLFYADPTNPQSLNLYSYVQNNPLTSIDADGLACVYFNDDGSVDHINQYDCDSENDNGYYIDIDGNNLIQDTPSLDNNGNLNGYCTNGGGCYGGDGSPLSQDPNTPVIQGWGSGLSDETSTQMVALTSLNLPNMVCISPGACFARTTNLALQPRGFGCQSKLLAEAALVGAAGGPPGSDPGGDVAHAVRDTAKNPAFRAMAYTLAKRAVGRVAAGAVDEVVPFAGWLAGGYIVASSLWDARDYYNDHATECDQ